MTENSMDPWDVQRPLPLPVRTMVGRELRRRRAIEWPNKARLAVVLTFDYHGGDRKSVV